MLIHVFKSQFKKIVYVHSVEETLFKSFQWTNYKTQVGMDFIHNFMKFLLNNIRTEFLLKCKAFTIYILLYIFKIYTSVVKIKQYKNSKLEIVPIILPLRKKPLLIPCCISLQDFIFTKYCLNLLMHSTLQTTFFHLVCYGSFHVNTCRYPW